MILAEPALLMGDVLCRACGYLLGPFARMRLYSHYYFVDDHDFYNRIEEKIFSQVEEHHRTTDTGNLFARTLKIRLSSFSVHQHRQSIVWE